MIQSPKILCIGPTPTMQRTMVFEKLHIDEVNRAKTTREFASGKAVNVARIIKTLGETPIITGFIGGIRGQMLRDDLKTSGIEDAMVEVTPNTRLCSTLIDQSNQTATELVEESAPVTPRDWQNLDAIIARLAPESAIWIFSGSLPPGSPPDSYAKWAPLAIKHNAKMIVDARGPALVLCMSHPNIIIKVNREELSATLNTNLQSESDLRSAMLSATPKNGALFVTAGKEGSWTSDGKEIHHLPPPKIKVLNPIGSGDAFAAGLAVGLLRHQNLFDSALLATACAAANAMTQDAGHAELSEINHLLALIPSPGNPGEG